MDIHLKYPGFAEDDCLSSQWEIHDLGIYGEFAFICLGVLKQIQDIDVVLVLCFFSITSIPT